MSVKKYTFNRGVHPFDNKAATENLAIEVMPLQKDYFVGLSQHIGAPAVLAVSEGDHVAQGQLIAKAAGKVSANIFSPVSGKIIGVKKLKNALAIPGDYVHIEQEGDDKVLLPEIDEITRDNVLNRIEEAGIVGLGGAGFPAAVKDRPNKPVDTLIINAAECEPYLNCDNRLLQEYTKEVIEGAKLLATACGVTRVIFGIEDNKPAAYAALLAGGAEVMLLKKRYPQGAEKMLIFACTKRKVPQGGLPMDAGVVVHNVATAYAVYDAVVNCEPLYKRVLTVAGKGVDHPKNLWVLNGTRHQAIFDECGINDKTVKLLSGGPMMGHALENLLCVTTKAESGLLALARDEIGDYTPTPCLNCGSCSDVCPMHLMPMFIDYYTQAGKTEEAVRYGARDCIECGCCAYVCPAKRPIVQSVRLTKQLLRGKK